MDRNEIEELIRQLEEPIDWAHFVNDDHAMDCQEFHILAASALRHLLQAQTWRPIEDEAKDGSSILTYPHFRVTSYNRYMDGFTRWSDEEDGCVLLRPQPTHWMRLPQPPDLIEERTSATPSEQQNDGDA